MKDQVFIVANTNRNRYSFLSLSFAGGPGRRVLTQITFISGVNPCEIKPKKRNQTGK